MKFRDVTDRHTFPESILLAYYYTELIDWNKFPAPAGWNK